MNSAPLNGFSRNASLTSMASESIRLVPPEDRVSGPGSRIIMAAFTHLNPVGSRFTDGTYGVFYAANDLATAIAETAYHREGFMRATGEGRMELDMRVHLVDLVAALHDLRGRKAEYPLVYHADNYAAGQHLAATLRKYGSNGIVYDSVRRQGGECVAVFRARMLSNCRQEHHLCYVWDGQRISFIYEKREIGEGATR
ncbi:MAG: RES family NAD+ phosphorylase [Blastochloris sp.]|nr:RES family NAD+ phosphorylase [Blastochloris sp.]